MTTPTIVTRIGKGAPLSFLEVDTNFTNLRDAISGLGFDQVSGDITITTGGVASLTAGSIVNADINADAAIAFSKLQSLAAGSVLLGDGSNVATATAITGDISLSSSGVVAITAGAIVDADINAAAAISGSKIDPDFGSQTVTTTGTAELGGINLTGGAYLQSVVAVAALDIDCSSGNYFTKTINGDSTFTVSNVPTPGVYAFTLELTHTSGVVTWFSGVNWPGGTAPTLTTGKTHLFVFVTDDGGTLWRGASLLSYDS